MKHFSHEHALILNEIYIARDGDLCRGCGEQISSCKSFVYSCSRITGAASTSSTDAGVYSNESCAKFLLHKNCAELPARIQNPKKPTEFLQLCFDYSSNRYLRILARTSLSIECDICGVEIPWSPKQFFYHGNNFKPYVCLNCFMLPTRLCLGDRKFKHPGHHGHVLSLIQQPSSFKCHACKVDDNIKDMSFRCTTCQFWMHKSCAEAPPTFRFQFHDKHPLTLSFSLPQVYRKFEQYCGLCKKKLSQLVWLYYCRKCRFFAHFQCARSLKGILNSCENEKYDSEVEQLPAPDETSVNLLREKFIKAKSIQNNNGSIFSSANDTPIKHWTHEEHLLQLINSNDLKNQQDVDKLSLLCDGCVQSIRTDEDQFYGCVTCKYFLHKFCAQLPQKIKLNIGSADATASKHNEAYKFFYCRGCGAWCNGIFFKLGSFSFHIGCATIPKMIKHEAHRHKLKHVFVRDPKDCKACNRLILWNASHKCEQCDYHICGSCIIKSSRVTHPWDPHSLQLIYQPGMVIDHEHDFSCEFCSKDIDTNYWFYHCSDCDISFHLLRCFEQSSYRNYSNVKFGARDIVIDELHSHSNTFVLNKRFRSCEKCHKNQLGEPVVECAAPCKSIFCTRCIHQV